MTQPRSIVLQVAAWIGRATASTTALVLVVATVLAWLGAGPPMRFSETWLLTITTLSAVVTLLMVFLIQNTQAREGAAVQAKLNELIRALESAENRFIGIEKPTQEELTEIQQGFETVDEVLAVEPSPPEAPKPRRRTRQARE